MLEEELLLGSLEEELGMGSLEEELGVREEEEGSEEGTDVEEEGRLEEDPLSGTPQPTRNRERSKLRANFFFMSPIIKAHTKKVRVFLARGISFRESRQVY